jgi:signal transduction histidine kinase
MECLQGIRVMGDETRLAQIIHHLVDNAIKFTPSGRIDIQLNYQRLIENCHAKIILHFSIKDTGIGIAEKNQLHIFDKFSQINNSSAKEYEGAGLGLALCKKLCQQMSGDIQLISQQDIGSEFSFQVKFIELVNSPMIN